MRNRILNIAFVLLVVVTGCAKMSVDGSKSSAASLSGSNGQGGAGDQNQAGVVTAGEWNDLNNWSFWETIIDKADFKTMPPHWNFFNNNRIAVNVADQNARPVVNAIVKLKRNGTVVFTAKTDNSGNAELWPDLFQNTPVVNPAQLVIDINNGSTVISAVKTYKDGINKAVVATASVANTIEVAFVVDATGSMGDELEYLKTELLDVISRVKAANANADVSTSAVFYRDEGDEYLTRISGFTTNNIVTTNFIKEQSAGGGGDFPEAVHTALDKAVNELQWSANAKTRLLFLVLDAPPHQDNNVISAIQNLTKQAAEKGIKIIPITASGIDKETEFLMRFMSITTNGTYVFITNHSGIGNEHLEPTVGQFDVEFLNNLMVRLINKYAK